MIDAVVTNHLKVLVGDMDNEFFNKLSCLIFRRHNE